MTKLFLKKKIAARIANGHPWVFGNEVDKIDGPIEPAAVSPKPLMLPFFTAVLQKHGPTVKK
jgi:hypothetical protein